MEICMTTTGARINPTGIDLLVTDRLCTSASEP